MPEKKIAITQGVFSNVLANLIAASFIYLIGVGVGLLPRQSESVALSAFVVLITTGVIAEILGGPVYRWIKNAAAASSFRLAVLAIILIASGLTAIASVFILRGSIDVWRLLLLSSIGSAATIAGVRVLPSEISRYRRAKHGPIASSSAPFRPSASTPRYIRVRTSRPTRPRRRAVAGRKHQ